MLDSCSVCLILLLGVVPGVSCCPLQVTAPQLSLLEAAMARMERVAVWSLMSGGRGGKDVFTVSAGGASHVYRKWCC